MEEWIIALISAIVGFLFTFVWDVIKTKKADSKKDKAFLNLLRDEIHQNENIAKLIRKLVETDIVLAEEEKHTLQPLPLLQTQTSDIIKFHVPDIFLDDYIGLTKLNGYFATLKAVNQLTSSRESFRYLPSTGYGEQVYQIALMIKGHIDSLDQDINDLSTFVLQHLQNSHS